MTEGLSWTTRLAEQSVDFVFGALPRAPISEAEWRACRLVAHRGCVDAARGIYENTLASFDAAREAGAWGIELDVQWTRDDWPVIIHDPNTAALPGTGAVEIAAIEYEELHRLSPLVPRLEEVLEQFAGELHLMIELKVAPPTSRAAARLAACLAPWQSVRDYHLMSLNAAELRELEDFPVAAKLLIATTNTRKMFAEFRQGGFGGLTGHYLLLNNKMRRHLAQQNIPWGTGFVNSINLLAREIRSGTRWIFSDAVQTLRQSG